MDEPYKFYLYLGAKGEDQYKTDEYSNPAPGGWNFGGFGGVDQSDYSPTEPTPPESGAGGGGAVDLRIDYIDINSPDLDDDLLTKSLMSRIIVAGSGGGAVSDKNINGYPGGTLKASNNGEHMFGGTQTDGILGKGMNGSITNNNQGGQGDCGSGYRGCYHTFTSDMTQAWSFEYGGSGGSSYISGHPGCISPQHPSDTIENQTTPFHESNFYFTNTIMKGGNENMPDPYSTNNIVGHIGHGVCRITFLFNPICQTHVTCYQRTVSIFLTSVFIFIGSE
ncbi:hypothetical protein TVAG_293810 [Trichomonas vaginalis G3]|uniref:receptor protein-tyrosine kinase n=1 Tax=Trichomonas vaginalis (strain ATCC PRA-98 / G3) TaxID=412133 RepID=A2FKB1_TRIV3|nr:glycine-rich protein family [Trichomonas vaginalis G3]EAX94651.1 hypothetical protein TVAG_293810 [Trichomonas vaginalis G3]KAI5503814.1 glycine-rich protein family [Trichomonas vaginalis G3]|eukprot:XP_001307581.1 hypothetical protein [Trichomonas vaginalis G3]